ncbi:MAG: RNA polymerase sigma factor [Gorillibacterium sp.]|nr:RNA polymerase sigma factor [Gorillibacterium sp.]
MIDIQEDKLIEQARQGNEAAVELLIRQTYDDIYRFVRWKVRDVDLAWDLSQMTFEKAWLRLDSFHGEQGSFRAWLLTIAHHVCIDYLRSKAVSQAGQQGSLTEQLAAKGDFLDGVLMREEVKLVYKAIGSLPEDHRDALLLRYKHELSFAEIAAVTETSESTVKSRVRRSLIKLRDLLNPTENRTVKEKHAVKKGGM